MAKVGRPRIGKDTKEKMLYCRITEKEFFLLQNIAEKKDMTLSALFRETIEKHLLSNSDLKVLLDNVEPDRKKYEPEYWNCFIP